MNAPTVGVWPTAVAAYFEQEGKETLAGAGHLKRAKKNGLVLTRKLAQQVARRARSNAFSDFFGADALRKAGRNEFFPPLQWARKRRLFATERPADWNFYDVPILKESSGP